MVTNKLLDELIAPVPNFIYFPQFEHQSENDPDILFITKNEFVKATNEVAEVLGLTTPKAIQNIKLQLLIGYYNFICPLPSTKLKAEAVEAFISKTIRSMNYKNVVCVDEMFAKSSSVNKIIYDAFYSDVEGFNVEALYLNKDVNKIADAGREPDETEKFLLDNLQDKTIYIFPKIAAKNIQAYITQSLYANLYAGIAQSRNIEEVVKANSVMKKVIEILDKDYLPHMQLTTKGIVRHIYFIIEHELQHARQSASMMADYLKTLRDFSIRMVTTSPNSTENTIFFYEKVMGSEAEFEANIVGLSKTIEKFGPIRFRDEE